MIIISHREAPIKDCDRVIKMEGGEIFIQAKNN
jgi:ABC-type bacteriocin/lantibiotic exporter with double-glycine peptidase domain